MKKIIPILLAAFVFTLSVYSQCTIQVFNTSGTTDVSGTAVTVTPAGAVDTFNTYCPSTLPYFIGYTWLTASGSGGYTFNFSPAVDSLTLNFSGTSDLGGNTELVQLFVNGTHYSIPAVGDPNTCDALAALTLDGDITGCDACSVSGWNGTTIAGPISSLLVYDTLLSGEPGGTLFSLFISDHLQSAVSNTAEEAVHISPNPFKDLITCTLQQDAMATLRIYNVLSQEIIRRDFYNSTTVETAALHSGVYFYVLSTDDEILSKGKLIK